jgi:hypothetical protein
MFKKLVIALFLSSWAVGLHAQTLTVYQPWPVGALNDLICRQLFKTYAEQTGTNTVIINKPGADTMLAHRELLNNSGLGLLCGGNGPVFYTTFKDSPKDAPAFNTVKPVLGVMKGTSFVFVPPNGPNSIEELIKKHKASGKSVLIGNLSRAGNLPMENILTKQGVNLEFVSSTNPGATLASLKDGTLDVYVDGGTLRPQLVNIAKEIAHIGLGGYKGSSENLGKKYPQSTIALGGVTIYAKSTMPDSQVEELSAKLKTIMMQNMQEFFKSSMPFHTVTGTGPAQTKEQLQQLMKYIQDNQ